MGDGRWKIEDGRWRRNTTSRLAWLNTILHPPSSPKATPSSTCRARQPEGLPMSPRLSFSFWTKDPRRRNVEIMKAKNLFALFITTTVLLSGCGKTDTKLQSENADLKARLQKLEQQLKAANSGTASAASQPASIQDLQSQLDEAQKKAGAAANELQSVSSQVETQKEIIVNLTRQLTIVSRPGKKPQRPCSYTRTRRPRRSRNSMR